MVDYLHLTPGEAEIAYRLNDIDHERQVVVSENENLVERLHNQVKLSQAMLADLDNMRTKQEPLRASIRELVKAMHRYEMDVDFIDDGVPREHREMMRRAEALLGEKILDQPIPDEYQEDYPDDEDPGYSYEDTLRDG